MKRITLLIFWVSVAAVGFGQQAWEGNYPFNKKIAKTAYGISVEVDGHPEQVLDMLSAELKKAAGKKLSNFKGDLKVLEAVKVPRVSPQTTMDVYVRTEVVDKKQPERSRIVLFLSSGNYNFMNKESHTNEMTAAKGWMEEMARNVELAIARETQKEAVAAMEKSLQDLEKERQALEQEQAEIARKLAEKLQEIEQRQQEMRKAKVLLSELEKGQKR